MWRNPNHGASQTEAPRPSAPAETGRRLATMPRSTRGGPEQELRVSLDEYQGHPYISIRLWQQDGRSGAWWPLKDKGISVRLREADDVAEAIKLAVRLADGPAPAVAPKRESAGPRRPSTRGRTAYDHSTLPAQPAGGGEFDEFAGGG